MLWEFEGGGIKEFFGTWQLFGKLDGCCFSTSWGMKYMEVYMASVYFIIRSPHQNQIVCGNPQPSPYTQANLVKQIRVCLSVKKLAWWILRFFHFRKVCSKRKMCSIIWYPNSLLANWSLHVFEAYGN